MLVINNVNIHIPADSGRMLVEFTEDYEWTNKQGKTWKFLAGWSSDSHSIPGGFQNFDRTTLSAMSHDQDCERANEAHSLSMRIQGDRDYRENMRDLGASRLVAYRRWLAVSGRTLKLKIQGKLK